MMSAASRSERIAVAIFALARTIVCGYRAAHQSITVDEATTYLRFVRDHWINVWTNYDPNNHVLFSIFSQLSVRALHISEFSLRLPTVLAGFFLVIGVHRVLEATVASRAIRWITLVAIGLAPLLLDFSVAARGYGLGVTLLVWAMYFSIRGRDAWAGVFAGLAMATTFHLAFSVIGLVACPLILGTGRWRSRFRRANAVAEIAAVIVIAICLPVLLQARGDQFYIGNPTFRAALYDFVAINIRAVPGHGGWLGSGDAIRLLEYVLLPAILLFVLAASVRVFRRDRLSRRSLLPALALVLALGATAAAHFLLGMNYPTDRLFLPFFVMLALAWAIAAAQVPNPRARFVNGLLAVVLIFQFAHQFHTNYFTLWQFDASIKQVARRLRDDLRGKPPASVSISATWYHWPALEYYRIAYRITALKPVERHDQTPFDGFDYYVLNGDDRAAKAAVTPGMVPLFKDDLSGVMLTK